MIQPIALGLQCLCDCAFEAQSSTHVQVHAITEMCEATDAH